MNIDPVVFSAVCTVMIAIVGFLIRYSIDRADRRAEAMEARLLKHEEKYESASREYRDWRATLPEKYAQTADLRTLTERVERRLERMEEAQKSGIDKLMDKIDEIRNH